MKTNDQKEFSTLDFPLAIVLYYFNFQLEGLESAGPSRVSFVFQETIELKETINKFWQKKLMVEPSKFLSVQRELKSRIYTQNQRGLSNK